MEVRLTTWESGASSDGVFDGADEGVQGGRTVASTSALELMIVRVRTGNIRDTLPTIADAVRCSVVGFDAGCDAEGRDEGCVDGSGRASC